jgi:hypothetical protein
MRRLGALFTAALLVIGGAIMPTPTTARADDPVDDGTTIGPQEFYGYPISFGNTGFVAAWNAAAPSSRSYAMRVSYVDASGPWDIDYDWRAPLQVNGLTGKDLSPQVWMQPDTQGAVAYTHISVRLSYRQADGSLATSESARIEVRDPVVAQPVSLTISNWRRVQTGYGDVDYGVSSDVRRRLPGQVCEHGCMAELWGVDRYGEKWMISSVRSSPYADKAATFPYSENMRLMPALSSLNGAERDFGPAYAVPDRFSVANQQVDIDATTALINSVASGLAIIDICAPMNAIRQPSDGTTSAAFLACTQAGERGGVRGVVYTMLQTYGRRAITMIVSAATTPPDQLPREVPRPQPPSNPIDPPGQNVPRVGDVYFSVLDRIEDHMRTTTASRVVTEDEYDQLARQCYRNAAGRQLGSDPRHPCEYYPIYMPGSDVANAAKHRSAAIGANPQWVINTKYSARTAPARDWYANEPECAARSVETPCDEFPNYITEEGGPATSSSPRSSLRVIDRSANAAEGGFLRGFHNRCGHQDGQVYVVAPTMYDIPDASVSPNIPTVSFCGEGS